MDEETILRQFRSAGALLEGHFLLSSGLHSPNYWQCALALQDPADATSYGQEIAARFPGKKFEMVASPAIGGLVIGFSVARALGLPFIWTERQGGEMTLRRGFSINPGAAILVVEDVITTGGSTRECINVLERMGGAIANAASIIDRSAGKADVGVSRIALLSTEAKSYRAEECPMCRNGSIAVKPGSRGN